MSIQRLSVIAVICLCLCCGAAADDLESTLHNQGFYEREIPVGDAWSQAIHDTRTYYIEGGDSILKIFGEEYGGIPRNLNVEAGELRYIGTNMGEFGGGLVVERKGGEQTELLSENVVSLIPIGDDLFIFTGLAHLSISQGAVHKIENYRQKTKPSRVSLLPDAPRIVFQKPSKLDVEFVVVGHSSVSVVSEDLLEVLYLNEFWGGLYPSSGILWDEMTLVIGMRAGVAVVNLDSYDKKVRFFAEQ